MALFFPAEKGRKVRGKASKSLKKKRALARSPESACTIDQIQEREQQELRREMVSRTMEDTSCPELRGKSSDARESFLHTKRGGRETYIGERMLPFGKGKDNIWVRKT